MHMLVIIRAPFACTKQSEASMMILTPEWVLAVAALIGAIASLIWAIKRKP